jgi:hypothetical protein
VELRCAASLAASGETGPCVVLVLGKSYSRPIVVAPD